MLVLGYQFWHGYLQSVAWYLSWLYTTYYNKILAYTSKLSCSIPPSFIGTNVMKVWSTLSQIHLLEPLTFNQALMQPIELWNLLHLDLDPCVDQALLLQLLTPPWWAFARAKHCLIIRGCVCVLNINREKREKVIEGV